jgi:hypothetical protein
VEVPDAAEPEPYFFGKTTTAFHSAVRALLYKAWSEGETYPVPQGTLAAKLMRPGVPDLKAAWRTNASSFTEALEATPHVENMGRDANGHALWRMSMVYYKRAQPTMNPFDKEWYTADVKRLRRLRPGLVEALSLPERQ